MLELHHIEEISLPSYKSGLYLWLESLDNQLTDYLKLGHN